LPSYVYSGSFGAAKFAAAIDGVIYREEGIARIDISLA